MCGQGVLSAVPLDKAHNLLKEKWASFAKMQEHQHALESVFHHRNTRRTTTTTTETTDTTTTRIQASSGMRVVQSGSIGLPIHYDPQSLLRCAGCSWRLGW